MQWLYATAKMITFKTTLPGTSWGDWWWRLQRDCVFTPGPLCGLQVNFYSTWSISSPSFTDCGVCRVVPLYISSLLSPRQGGGRGLGYLCLSFMWVLCVSAAKCSLWLGQSVWPVMSVSCLCVSVHPGYMLSCATAWKGKVAGMSHSLGRDPGHWAGSQQLDRSSPGTEQLEEAAALCTSLNRFDLGWLPDAQRVPLSLPILSGNWENVKWKSSWVEIKEDGSLTNYCQMQNIQLGEDYFKKDMEGLE